MPSQSRANHSEWWGGSGQGILRTRHLAPNLAEDDQLTGLPPKAVKGSSDSHRQTVAPCSTHRKTWLRSPHDFLDCGGNE
jgi:hypothetical protein